MTSLMLACRLGHESMVDMLVSVFGAEIDPADKVRQTKTERTGTAGYSSVEQNLVFSGPLRSPRPLSSPGCSPPRPWSPLPCPPAQLLYLLYGFTW